MNNIIPPLITELTSCFSFSCIYSPIESTNTYVIKPITPLNSVVNCSCDGVKKILANVSILNVITISTDSNLPSLIRCFSNGSIQCVSFSLLTKYLRATINKNVPPKAAIIG